MEMNLSIFISITSPKHTRYYIAELPKDLPNITTGPKAARYVVLVALRKSFVEMY